MSPRPSIMLPALYGGLIIAAISVVPGLNLLNCCCCAGILLGGMMSVFFFKNTLLPDHPPLTSADAIQLGALAGVFGALIGSAITAAILATIGNINGRILLDLLEDFHDQVPPEALDQLRDRMMTGGPFIITLIGSLVLDTVFGLLGGLIGFAIWKPKAVMAPPPSYMPPPQAPPPTV